MTTAFLFPGQSSRYPGMLEKFISLNADLLGPIVKDASDIIGRDLRAHYHEDNADKAFIKNVDVQLGVFIANHLMMTYLKSEGIDAQLSLGLSLGEWNHVVHIGALSFADALKAVEARGNAYDRGPSGSMASVFPASVEELEEITAKVKEEGKGIVEVVNLNSPRQQVLSGEHHALERALELIEEETYATATIIEKHVPMHCSTFEPVAKEFADVLMQLNFKQPNVAYFPNRLAEKIENPTKEQWVDLLSMHVCRPVLWRHSIDAILATDPNTIMIEVGPRKVLYNLIEKKWHKGAKRLHTDSAENLNEHLSEMKQTFTLWNES